MDRARFCGIPEMRTRLRFASAVKPLIGIHLVLQDWRTAKVGEHDAEGVQK